MWGQAEYFPKSKSFEMNSSTRSIAQRHADELENDRETQPMAAVQIAVSGELKLYG
jgi:hypothetical protein